MEFEILFKSAAAQSCFLTSQPAITRSTAGPADADAAQNSATAVYQAARSVEHEAEKLLQLYTCFPVLHHPRQAALEAQSRVWLTDLYSRRLSAHLVQRLMDTRLETLACVFFPHSSDEKVSLTLIKLIHWFFVIDDVLDDPHRLGHNYDAAHRFACHQFKAMFGEDIKEAQAVGLIGMQGYEDDVDLGRRPASSRPQAGKLSSDGDEQLARAQEELAIEVGVQFGKEMQARGLSVRQLERLRYAVAEYLLGIISIGRFRQEKRLPSLEEYIRLRRMDGGDKLNFLADELDVGMELDDDTLQHPLIQELHNATTDQALWLNDLLSFNREYHNKDYVNLPAVLHYNKLAPDCGQQPWVQASNMADFQETLEKVHTMIKACEQKRIRLAHDIIAWKPELTPYVEATHCNVSGLTFWTLWSSRYHTRGPLM